MARLLQCPGEKLLQRETARGLTHYLSMMISGFLLGMVLALAVCDKRNDPWR